MEYVPSEFPEHLGVFSSDKQRAPRNTARPINVKGELWVPVLGNPALLQATILEKEEEWFQEVATADAPRTTLKDRDVIVDMFRTLAVFRGAPRRKPTWVKNARGHVSEIDPISGFTCDDPRLPSLARALWPLSEEDGGVKAAALGMYSVAAYKEFPDLGVDPRQLCPVSLVPFRTHSDTRPLSLTQTHAPFCSPSPEYLRTVSELCPSLVRMLFDMKHAPSPSTRVV
jgi:hypothetical protein